ncbi:50S ribosomal protein L28 [Patescibacteria group bacterium]|nr:50S ribosomal protein L28 [Patescibacteria group bacterium]
MAKVCEICNRGKLSANTRSHSNIASKRTMKLNLQSKKIGNSKMTVCTSCLKTLNKLRKNQTIK